MSTTAFLSMWISNTATSAMMLPIAHAVLEEIRSENEMTTNDRGSEENVITVRYTRRYNGIGDNHSDDTPTDDTHQDVTESVHLKLKSENNGTPDNYDSNEVTLESATGNDITGNGNNSPAVCTSQSMDTTSSEALNTVREGEPSSPATPVTRSESSDKTFDRMTKCLMLGVAYAANIGGTGTLTGTGPNIVLGELGKLVTQTVVTYSHKNASFHGCTIHISFCILFLYWQRIWCEFWSVVYLCHASNDPGSFLFMALSLCHFL